MSFSGVGDGMVSEQMWLVRGCARHESWYGHGAGLRVWVWEGKGALPFLTEVTLAHLFPAGTALLATTPAPQGFTSQLYH